MLENAWIIPLIPAASFFLILFFGKRLPRKGSELGIAAVGIAFVLAIATNVQWFDHVNNPPHESETHTEEEAPAESGEEEHGLGAAVSVEGESAAPAPAPAQEAEGEEAAEEVHEVEPIERGWTWFENGGVDIEVGMLLDGPAVMMLFVVTLVSLLVHVYSTDYVAGDRRYTHFFAFLSLFTASMLGLVMAKTTLQLIVCWELVGVCSFVLIGHWWEEKANSDAALKAFITNRVGDVGLIVGVITLFFAAGQTFDIVETNTAALDGTISHLALLVAACSLIAAVMSKSGQFILHMWLPDAMAGPTPVSALIHAATMVVAGIYMVGRLYAVFFEGLSIGTSSVNLLAVVGGVTVIGGAGLAFVQNDIKKVLAYSTVSQLGYMVMALGIGAWTAAFFHLFTHAFFKACLFLGSGSVSHAVHSFDMKKDMGGLRKWMPQTYKTFVIATAALIGIFPLAGFWSKDEILAGASQLGGAGHYTAFMVVGIVGALMTAAYMTRTVYLTFFGEYRGHAPRPPARVGPPHHGAAVDPRGARRDRRLRQPPGRPRSRRRRAAVRALLRAQGPLLPDRELQPPRVLARHRTGRHGHRPHRRRRSRTCGTGGGSDRTASPSATGWPAPGTRCSRTSTTSTGSTPTSSWRRSRARSPGPSTGSTRTSSTAWSTAPGALSTVVGRFVYDRIDQQVVDGAVNRSASAANESGQVFRQLTSGKVQQYGALLFGAAAIFAGAIIIFV